MFLRKLLQPFYTIYVVTTFVAGLLLNFPFFLLISIANNAVGRRMIYKIIKWWSWLWLWLIGMPLRRQGKKPPEGRYVIVANHISYLDTVVLFFGLPGYFRPLGKIEFAKVPLFGFLYKQMAIMVDRRNAQSRARSMRLMWRVLKREGDILIFPEGTFNETGKPLREFYDGAFRLAITSQTPMLPVIFPDTADRWHYSHWWKIWPGINRVAYLDPVSVAGLTMENLPALKEKVFRLMEAELMKYRAYPSVKTG
jgi:1-acyl-sn-glycerol-3-phosphate acyltransferase